MRSRANDPKRYYFLRLQEKYDRAITAFKKRNRDLLLERVSELNDFIKERSSMYGITAPEVKQYFRDNKLSLNFKL